MFRSPEAQLPVDVLSEELELWPLVAGEGTRHTCRIHVILHGGPLHFWLAYETGDVSVLD